MTKFNRMFLEEISKIHYNINSGGFSALERLTCTYFLLKGYHIDDIIPEEHGSSQFDFIAEKESGGHIIKIAVMIINHKDPAGPIEIHRLSEAMDRHAISNGMIVSFCGFIQDAIDAARRLNIDPVDSETLICRLRPMIRVSHSIDPGCRIIKVTKGFAEAVYTGLENPAGIAISHASLSYMPFIVMEYEISTHIMDNKSHREAIRLSGKVIVDSITRRVMTDSDTGLGEYYDMMIREINTSDYCDSFENPGKGYTVSVLPPSYQIKEAESYVRERSHIIFEKYITFSEGGPYEIGHIKIRPAPDEVIIKKVYLTYVPVWEVEFRFKDRLYIREALAGSGLALVDPISICHSHGSADRCRKATVAICDDCGRPFCDQHIHKCSDCDVYLCTDHTNRCMICGKHYCNSHSSGICKISEDYNNLLRLRRTSNTKYLRIVGASFIVGAVFFVFWKIMSMIEYIPKEYGDIIILGQPIIYLTLSFIMFGLLFLSLDFGFKKGPIETNRRLSHKVIKGPGKKDV